MSVYLFTMGTAQACTQGFRLPDGSVRVVFGFAPTGESFSRIAHDVAQARAASQCFLNPPPTMNAEGLSIPTPPSQESLKAALGMLGRDG